MADLSKKRSIVWKHFSIVDSIKAKCAYCGDKISYSGGGTGNLTRHIKSKHGQMLADPVADRVTVTASTSTHVTPTPTINENETAATTSTAHDIAPAEAASSAEKPPPRKRSRMQNITEFVQSTKPMSVCKSKQMDEQVTKMIVKGYHAFAMVDEPEFRTLFKMAIPNYTLPTKKTVSNSLIPRLYNTTKESVQEQLNTAEAICLTTDGWTSLVHDSYLAVTAHYIDTSSAEFKNFLLGCLKYNEKHTAENLSNFLIDQAASWNIQHKIAGVITDNANNEKAAVRLTGWRHFPCFAHTLNLVVRSSLVTIKAQVDKVKSIIEFFNRSTVPLAKLHIMQQQLGLPSLKLKQDVVTRWNSTYLMLERIITLKNAVISTLAMEQPRLNVLDEDEWSLLEKCMQVLKIFYEVTVEVSGEKYVSMSKVIIYVKTMKQITAQYNDTLPTFRQIIEDPASTQQNYAYLYKTFVTKLRTELDDRFRNIEHNELTSQASFLDPRFKKKAFSSREAYEQCLKTVKNTIRTISVPEASVEQTSHQQETPSSSLLWQDFDQEVQSLMAATNPFAASQVQVDKYLNEPLIRRNEDPLKWWHERRHVYPRLHKLMLRRLCLTATSVPCERIFSKAGLTISTKRSCLKPEKASQVLFLNHNL